MVGKRNSFSSWVASCQNTVSWHSPPAHAEGLSERNEHRNQDSEAEGVGERGGGLPTSAVFMAPPWHAVTPSTHQWGEQGGYYGYLGQMRVRESAQCQTISRFPQGAPTSPIPTRLFQSCQVGGCCWNQGFPREVEGPSALRSPACSPSMCRSCLLSNRVQLSPKWRERSVWEQRHLITFTNELMEGFMAIK